MTAIRCTRALWTASAALAVWLVASLGATRSGVWINVSPSLPLGVYRVVAGPPVRGAIVLVCLGAAIGRLARARGYLGPGPCPGGAGRLGKTVAAVAGDTVDVETSGVTINGRAILSSAPLARDAQGRTLARVAPGARVIPEGMLFLLSTQHPRSFDSRYYGVVPATAVVARVRAIATCRPCRGALPSSPPA
jgi:conjugative transfer signal peptidase TraF